ncbi:transglutaminase family protein [Parablastomonas sp. CN1-191]|uniref:transglutaminase family protein n=1 Tax=Parablastomonas sp. CN1-191 TaxID=3400908 RepID=UPI003BF8DACB
MLLSIEHTTSYSFAEPVAHGLQRLRLTPKSTQGQKVLDWTMTLAGGSSQVDYDDHNHNRVTLLSVVPGAREVTVTCRGTVETSDHAGVIGHHAGHMPLWLFRAQTPLTRPGPRVRAILARAGDDGGDTLATLHRLSAEIRGDIAYVVGATDTATTAEEAATLGQGVCQDHAHVFIGAARAMGIPARYVSGYLMMNDRIEQDAGHAWAEAHVDGLGWVGFDISNAISPDPRYVRVATGRDYAEAAPITGLSFGGGKTELTVALAVEQRQSSQ